MSTTATSSFPVTLPFTKRMWVPYQGATLSEGLHLVTTHTKPINWNELNGSYFHWFGEEFSQSRVPGFSKRFNYKYTSTDNTADVLISHMRENSSPVPDNLPELRVFAFPEGHGLVDRLVLYYEIGYMTSNLMVGYVTNYSGAGKEGKKNLDSLFMLIQEAYKKHGVRVDYYESCIPLPQQIALQLL